MEFLLGGVCIARAYNGRRCPMFPDIGGSIAFVL
jgi:hypothetical protein